MTNSVNIKHGTLWTIIWWGLKLSLKFISNLLLTRLLTPEIFGIAAIGNTVISGITMLSDFGVKQSVIRSHRNDSAFFQTAWTIQLARGLLLSLIIIILAKPVADFYKSDDLAVFLYIVAASNLAMGLNNIELMRDYKGATIGKIAKIDMFAAVIGLFAMCAWAWFSPTVIALAIGAVVSTIICAAGTLIAYNTSNCRFRLEKSAAIEFLGFGKWILFSTILAFATTQMDKLALGKLVSMHTLGLYSIAFMWTSIPSQILIQWSNGVFYPLAAHQHRNNAVEDRIWSARRMFLAITCIASIYVYAISDILVQILYTDDYQAMAPLIRKLVIVLFLYTSEESISQILIAQGKPREKIFGQVLSVAIFLGFLIPAYQAFEVTGIILLLGVSSAIRILWMTYKLLGGIGMELKYDGVALASLLIFGHGLFLINGSSHHLTYQLIAVTIEAVVLSYFALVAYQKLNSLFAQH